MDYETSLRVNELAEIIKLHRHAADRLKRFRASYPYLLAPNLLAMIEDNLRDNVAALTREMSQLQTGKQAAVGGDPSRFICTRCKAKFAVPLRDGLCDECRSKMA